MPDSSNSPIFPADYPSWSDDRDAYADAKWSAAPPAASHYGGGGGGGYPGADAYSAAPDAYSGGAAGGYAQYESALLFSVFIL